MPRVTQSHRDRQAARILDAAAVCFARRGFQATSMDEIIGAAGMSSSTVYRYFPEVTCFFTPSSLFPVTTAFKPQFN